MLPHASLQCDGNIECPARRNRPADTGHRDHSNILNLDIRRRLGNEDQTLIQEVQKPFVGLDGALDSAVAVVAVKCQKVEKLNRS